MSNGREQQSIGTRENRGVVMIRILVEFTSKYFIAIYIQILIRTFSGSFKFDTPSMGFQERCTSPPLSSRRVSLPVPFLEDIRARLRIRATTGIRLGKIPRLHNTSILTDHGGILHPDLIPPLHSLGGLINRRHVWAGLHGIYEDRTEIATRFLDAYDEVDAVVSETGLVFIFANFHEADLGLSGGLSPEAHGVEVYDLTLVALFPHATEGDRSARLWNLLEETSSGVI